MDSKMMQLVGVTEREVGEDKEKKSFWTRIGVGFENRDGSYTLRFEFLPSLEPAIAVEAVDLPAWDHRDAADRLIVASARFLNAVLVTRDGAILDYAIAASAVRVLDPSR